MSLKKIITVLLALIAIPSMGQIEMSTYNFSQTTGVYEDLFNGLSEITILGIDTIGDGKNFDNQVFNVAQKVDVGKAEKTDGC